MNVFSMNGYIWRVRFVEPYSPMLVDRTGKRTVATTDPTNLQVCLSNELQGDFLIQVLLHELGHCALYSFNLIDDIHRMVYPDKWVEAEEWVCNFIADYGFRIFSTAYSVLGDDALKLIPPELDKLIA